MKQVFVLAFLVLAGVGIASVRADDAPPRPDRLVVTPSPLQPYPPDTTLPVAISGNDCNEDYFPVIAQRLGEQGDVEISFFVGPNGQPTSLKVSHSSGLPRLDTAAMTCLQAWRFMPAMHKGAAAYVTVSAILRMRNLHPVKPGHPRPKDTAWMVPLPDGLPLGLKRLRLGMAMEDAMAMLPTAKVTPLLTDQGDDWQAVDFGTLSFDRCHFQVHLTFIDGRLTSAVAGAGKAVVLPRCIYQMLTDLTLAYGNAPVSYLRPDPNAPQNVMEVWKTPEMTVTLDSVPTEPFVSFSRTGAPG